MEDELGTVVYRSQVARILSSSALDGRNMFTLIPGCRLWELPLDREGGWLLDRAAKARLHGPARRTGGERNNNWIGMTRFESGRLDAPPQCTRTI